MNIFAVDNDPIVAAQNLCDKHCVKMVLETAQMLCAVSPLETPYRKTHTKHPCTLWAGRSHQNYEWLLEHGIALSDEYTFRYGKTHKSLDVISWCEKNRNSIRFSEFSRTPFAMAMPEKYHSCNPIQSYRQYYIHEKKYMATWNRGRKEPEWWTTAQAFR